MNSNVEKLFAKAIIDLVIFIEFSSGDSIDEDHAVAALEQLASVLCEADNETTKKIISLFYELANDYGENKDFVKNLPETLGLL